MVVHELLLSDISHRDIKRAIANLRAEYGDWPLTQAKLGTFEGALIARHGSAAYDIGKRGWQQIVEPENLEAIAVQLNYGGWALRKVPDIRHIEVSPFRLSGRPTIRGRRVPAAKVGRLAESDMGVIVLRTDYALTTDEIDNALRWLRATQELSEAA